MTYEVSHKARAIHVTATANATLGDATKIEGLKTFTLSESTELAELKHLNSGGVSDHEPVWTSYSGTLSGEVKRGSATQAVLAAANKNKTPFYATIILDPDAAPGSRGVRWALVVESAEEPLEAGALVTFSYGVKSKGGPVDV
jgi:hypothetical protein